ncbi:MULTISPECIES: polysaccharide deacetylase family protein [Bradyrhizobium]|uniref:polysaccharide deacetylase family protein n=1 Tax=Bradyrhizobium TaxID=374 RepID=UPI00067EC054|nr:MULTISPECIES: polysaccharide deacetylase family protein [Bradyrhizobium]
MTFPAYITTSWDDGHPLDHRVAALLSKYRLEGTFYVPATTSDRPTMSAKQLRELSKSFEIGAHTLNHVDLTSVTTETASREIADSKSWIEDSTGVRCECFCPPIGRYRKEHVHMVQRAGYIGLRTVELLAIDFPRSLAGLLHIPTTVQAFPHRRAALARNVIKRMAFGNLWRYIRHGRTADWPALAESLLSQVVARGGVFHLWGHSWELEELDQWQRLESVLRLMGQFARQAPAVSNGQLCRLPMPPVAASGQTVPAAEAAAAGGRR